jgi:hypothetical protein
MRQSKKLLPVFLSLLFVCAIGCSDDEWTKKVCREDLGSKWNLPGECGTWIYQKGCTYALFEINGKRYAVNGIARSNTNLPHLDEIMLPDPELGIVVDNIIELNFDFSKEAGCK